MVFFPLALTALHLGIKLNELKLTELLHAANVNGRFSLYVHVLMLFGHRAWRKNEIISKF